MKQRAQVNIIYGDRLLHYMVELHDSGMVETTHGAYSYRHVPEGVQFIRQKNIVSNFKNQKIHNAIRDLNTWTADDLPGSNLNIPEVVAQRQMTLYIPRYSMESFYDEEFGEDSEMQLSGLKYILTAHTYIAGVKVILGSYIFDLGSAVAPNSKVRYKADEYEMCVDFNIVDPFQLTYDDKWIPFRRKICKEPEYINATGSIIHIDLEPVIESDEGDYYIRSSYFMGGMTSIPFEKANNPNMHADLNFDGNATISLGFNEVYEGDIALYLAETYNLWKVDEDGHWILDDDGKPIPRVGRMVYELIIRDKENVFDQHVRVTTPVGECVFTKDTIWHDWNWYKDGLILQGSVEMYDVDDLDEESRNDADELRTNLVPIADILTNEIPLNKELYKFLVPVNLIPYPRKNIDLRLIDMINYNVSVVNKIHKDIVTINRPEDYKANIIRPVFITTNPLGNLTIHPAVTENIAINLNSYKANVELFYLRVEGVDFVEIGRTNSAVIFTIDGHLLPNETTEGMAYILNEKYELVTTAQYTYEQ